MTIPQPLSIRVLSCKVIPTLQLRHLVLRAMSSRRPDEPAPRLQQSKLSFSKPGHNKVPHEPASRVEKSKTTPLRPNHPKTMDSVRSNKSRTFEVIEEEGDLFAAPDNSILIHACNCLGSWGGGIALAFKKKYPKAYEVYAKHCRGTDTKKEKREKLLNTAQLIPPLESAGPKHFVGCIYTSVAYGRGRDSPSEILEATVPAMEAMFKEINKWNDGHGEREKIQKVYMCKINSGLFRVKWEDSKAVIETLATRLIGLDQKILVVSPPDS